MRACGEHPIYRGEEKPAKYFIVSIDGQAGCIGPEATIGNGKFSSDREEFHDLDPHCGKSSSNAITLSTGVKAGILPICRAFGDAPQRASFRGSRLRSAAETTLPITADASTTDAETLARIVIRCMACEARFTGAEALTSCPACGNLLDVVIPTRRQLSPDDLGVNVPATAQHSGVWRYLPLLPALPTNALVSRWEGNTPLYRDDRLARYAGLPDGHLELKHEGHNPTGSFKDRGMTVGVSHAKAVGARIVACASTGNTSASLAAYAAAAGIPALVLVPDTKVAAGKLAQTVAYGAKVVQVDVEVAVDLDDRRAVGDGLGQLSRRDLRVGNEDERRYPGCGRICGE